jgi:hypothetical protein
MQNLQFLDLNTLLQLLVYRDLDEAAEGLKAFGLNIGPISRDGEFSVYDDNDNLKFFITRTGTVKTPAETRKFARIDAAIDEASRQVREATGKSSVSSFGNDRTTNNVMRHEYRVLEPAERDTMKIIKDMGADFHRVLDSIGYSSELTIAKQKIREAVMWAVSDITK